MAIIAIRHLPESDPPRFYLQGTSGKATAPAAVLTPVSFPVEGQANSSLVRELGWYLETFLEYPFSPWLERAEHGLDALRAWGEQAFDALFGDRDGGVLFAKATAGGHEELLLQAWSDDARILAWPWEALRDPKIGALASVCRIERRLNEVADPAPVPAGLPMDRVHILLVIARPFEGDVKYRSIARPLVELIETEGLPADVHVLRLPTFDQLREHLGKRPGYYHLVHFDGHGNYGKRPSAAGQHTYGAAEGELVFEDVNGKEAPVTAEKLSAPWARRARWGDPGDRAGVAAAGAGDPDSWARRRGEDNAGARARGMARCDGGELRRRKGNEYGAADTYAQLGILADLQGHIDESGQWLIKSTRALTSCNDPEGARRATSTFLVLRDKVSPSDRTKLEALWKAAGLGDLPLLPRSEP